MNGQEPWEEPLGLEQEMALLRGERDAANKRADELATRVEALRYRAMDGCGDKVWCDECKEDWGANQDESHLPDCPVRPFNSEAPADHTHRRELVLRRGIMDVMCSPGWSSFDCRVRLRKAITEAYDPGAHPEDRCEECRDEFKHWFASPEDWETATGRGWGGPILCKPCFQGRLDALADPEKGGE